MSHDAPLTEIDVPGGSRLTLYANRLVQHGGDAMECIPLSQLASVRVAFERDSAKLAWAIVLLAAAFALAAISGPLQRGIAGAMAKFGDPARPESLDAVLHGVFRALGGFASLFPGFATAMGAGAVALLVVFWLGTTTLTFAFAATERVFAVRGRNPLLVQFAESVGERLSAPRE